VYERAEGLCSFCGAFGLCSCSQNEKLKPASMHGALGTRFGRGGASPLSASPPHNEIHFYGVLIANLHFPCPSFLRFPPALPLPVSHLYASCAYSPPQDLSEYWLSDTISLVSTSDNTMNFSFPPLHHNSAHPAPAQAARGGPVVGIGESSQLWQGAIAGDCSGSGV